MVDIESENYEMLYFSAVSKIWYESMLYFNEIFSDFKPQKSKAKNEAIAKKIISYIKTHYYENIIIDDIARYIGISRSECFKCFKQFTSRTPTEYIIEYRIISAANMLKSTDENILEICIKCGFSSSSYFGKKFREHYGVSPSQYRKINSKRQ